MNRWNALDTERKHTEEDLAKQYAVLETQREHLEQERLEVVRLRAEALKATEGLVRLQKEKESMLEKAREQLRKEATEFEDQVSFLGKAS